MSKDRSTAEEYVKTEHLVPMRDGVRLFTSVYVPRRPRGEVPILLNRTPYGAGPYGEALRTRLGPSETMRRDGYVFAYQDVRGRMMSEGAFEPVRPYRPSKSASETDESTDAFDTIGWLLDHVDGHNGRVGVWGISAPGFYATHALIDAHPALRAVSPQAPVTDWFLGDDRHHNGAFLLQATFSFLSWFGAARPQPVDELPSRFDAYETPDGYDWYLRLGPLSTVNETYFHGENEAWNAMMEHGTYDAFWQTRTPLPHLRDVKPAVLVTGGFFDTHDLYGPLKTYDALAAAGADCYLAMGPWWHGGWARSDGESYGPFHFGQRTAEFYRQNVERAFFDHFLRDGAPLGLARATVFSTGSNRWHFFDAWPPSEAHDEALYLTGDGRLTFDEPDDAEASVEFVSDPDVPVPHTPDIVIHRDDAYVLQDQRFSARRPDVLVFASDPLTRDITLAGRLWARLFVETTGTDADFIVKLIDVYPGDAHAEVEEAGVPMGGFQMLVRGEVMRAKFRTGFTTPEPLQPGEVTEVPFDMQDVAHTFRRRHRIMVHVQSTWFPLIDRNPQIFTDIYTASEADFHPATHHVHCSRRHASRLEFQRLV